MAIRGYTVLHRRWTTRKPVWYAMLAELVCTIPLLVLFGIAQPDVFRTLMWKIGWAEGLNSDPRVILYAYANHRPLPKIPFVWSQSITDLNVAISIISLFTLLAKMITVIMKVYFPVIAVGLSFVQVALYATSVYGQAGPDYSDSRFPSPVPWYLSKSCSVGEKYGAGKTCMIVKSTFAVTVLMLSVYLFNLGFAIYNMIPRKNEEDFDDDDEENGSRSTSPSEDKTGTWEMQPQTPRGMPFTPRTQAFHTLDRKLPFRQYG